MLVHFVLLLHHMLFSGSHRILSKTPAVTVVPMAPVPTIIIDMSEKHTKLIPVIEIILLPWLNWYRFSHSESFQLIKQL